VADQSEKSKPNEVSSESRVERDASRAGSDQAQADMPEHLLQTSKEKDAFDRAGLIPTARSHVSETFGRPEISEETDGQKILHVTEVSDKKAPKTSDPHPSYTRGLEAARQSAATPDEAAKMEIQFTEQYIEKKLQEAATTSGKDPAELLNHHEYDPEDPNHGGTLKIPQNVAERNSDGSVLLKINVSENVEATEEAQLKNTPDGWLEAGRRIAELPIDKQFEIIGSGLAAGISHYQHDENQRAWGRLIGTVQGIGEVSVNLAKIADFSAALILNDEERAGKMGAEFGQALGETIVGGVRLFNAADQYLFNIGFTGDYAKPFRDVAELGNAMNEKWESLPPKEQERIKFKLLTELGADTLIGGAGIHSAGRASKLTNLLDDIAEQMAKQGTKTLEGAKTRAKAIKEGLEDLMLPEAVTPDGQRLRKGLDTVEVPDSKTGQASSIKEITSSSGERLGTIDDTRARRRVNASEVNKDSTPGLPRDFEAREKYFADATRKVNDAFDKLPDHVKEEVLEGFLQNNTRIVRNMREVRDVLTANGVDKNQVNEFMGALAEIPRPNDTSPGELLIVALSTRNSLTGRMMQILHPDGVARHEVAHAIDKFMGKDGHPFSESLEFIEAFYADVMAQKTGLLTREEHYRLTEYLLNHSEKGPSEIFAQLMAMRQGGCPFPEDQSLFWKAFPSVRKLVQHVDEALKTQFQAKNRGI